ncbi:hypothetical protein TGAM01_v205033 [Trichoderma gamsii]|uniref:Transmembrane protein n=2 Tax=Trichoderma gamsii TaxID=398673 RepID=A0A2P4ZP81_9HYPO|nr:hypothetical protein TGAM01_v205033 [Trichoderma gamsii]PON26089.1 hypothetical protein TGAM01_v205033 [Trichoderma gamsii]
MGFPAHDMPCQARILFLAANPPILFIFALLFFSFLFSFFFPSSNPLVVRALVRLVSPEQFLRASLANRQSRPSTIQATPSFFSLPTFSLSNKTKKDPFCLHPLHVSRLTQQTKQALPSDTMAAIDKQLIAARDVASQLMKRKNFAAREPGVIVVFCIVFIVSVGVLGLLIHKWIQRRKAATKSQI